MRSRQVAMLSLVGLWLFAPSVLAQEREIRIIRDVRYIVRSTGPLYLDAYLPPTTGPHPAVLVIPGGRWFNSDKGEDDWLPIDLARRGFAAFAVNYRPSTEAIFPAALEDVQSAIRFVREHAARFEVDPRRFAALGGSAGGHLAALLATWGEGSTDEGSRVRVAVSWSGPMDLRRLLDPLSDQENVSAVETFLGCSTPAECAEAARLASPISHVDPSDGAIYLANSIDEIIPEQQAESMAAALARHEVPHQLSVVNSGSHGLGAAESAKGFDPAFAFLTRWIDPDAATGAEPSPSTQKPGSADPTVASPATGGDQKGSETRTENDLQSRWLLVIALSAFVVAIVALFLAIASLKRVSRVMVAGGLGANHGPTELGTSRPSIRSRTEDGH